jgi:hypothetical protein
MKLSFGMACIVLETRRKLKKKSPSPSSFPPYQRGMVYSPPKKKTSLRGRTVSDFTFLSLIYIMENKYVDGEQQKKEHLYIFL